MVEGHDIAQVCGNGHVINTSARSMPQFNQKHCSQCGAPTITTCPDCNEAIQGHYYSPGIFSLSEKEAPRFCRNCGKPYPWTRNALEAASEMADTLDNLGDAERQELKNNFADVVSDTPRTPVAASKIKKLLVKAGGGALEVFQKILVDVVSETVKKSIWP